MIGLGSTTLLCTILMLCTFGAFNVPEYNAAHYRLKRQKQSEEVRNLLSFTEEMARKIVRKLYEGIIEVLQRSYQLVKSEDMDQHPMNETVGNAFVLVFENTPWFLELSLLYPEEAHDFLDNQTAVSELLQWAVDTTVKSGLLTKEELEVLNLAQQELHLIPRSPDFKNPHSSYQRMMREKLQAQASQEEAKKKSRKIKKGPQLTPRVKTDL